MADKNKKTKPLASRHVSRTAARLEIIPTLTQPVTGPRAAAPADGCPAERPAENRLRSKIDNLESGLRASEARRQALERELEVREEITDTINRDIRQARVQLEDATDEIEHLRHEYTGLKARLKKALRRSSDYERRLKIKDKAISNLKSELADATGQLGLTGEIENILQKIDGARPTSTDSGQPKDRSTRQLIGKADGKELRFPLFRDRLTIGRTRHNDIQLNLRFVSRRHAVVATDNNITRIIDWGSRNGVFVNQKRVTEKILESGDVITVGRTHLRYEERQKR